MNHEPRRTDTGYAYDRLNRIGRGRGVQFAVYDPNVHGVWELVNVGDKVLRPRFLSVADGAEMERARDDAAAS